MSRIERRGALTLGCAAALNVTALIVGFVLGAAAWEVRPVGALRL
jgi:hypothetical protein